MRCVYYKAILVIVWQNKTVHSTRNQRYLVFILVNLKAAVLLRMVT